MSKNDKFTGWDILPPEYKWIARDAGGHVWAYDDKPYLMDNYNKWMCNPKIRIDQLTCYERGTVDWKDSLICREEKTNE